MFRFPFALLPLLAVISPFSCAQSNKLATDRTILTISERRALARPILLHAESVSSTFDPTSKANLLYRAAGAWYGLDPSHAMSLYVQAFDAARESDPRLRADIEDQILDELMSISSAKVLDLLKDTDPKTQAKVYRSLMDLAFAERDNGLAARVFAAAIQYYQAYPDTAPFHWGLANLIAGSYEQLPTQLLPRAIDTVLSQAADVDKQQPESHFVISAMHGVPGIEFHSNYDFQLFAIIPALQRSAPERATAFLSQHPEIGADVKRFPDGIRSLDELGFPFGEAQGGGTDVRVTHHLEPDRLQGYDTVGKGPQSLAARDLGLEFTVPRDLNTLPVTGFLRSVSDGQVNSFVNITLTNEDMEPSLTGAEVALLEPSGACPADMSHRLEDINASPITRGQCIALGGPMDHMRCSQSIDRFPRADILQAVAEHCTYHQNSEAARLALRDQLEVLDQMPALVRMEYLLTVADLYLRIGDRQAAADVVSRGFAAVQAVYARDSSAASLANVPKVIWSSAEAYRRVITLGVNADPDATRKAIDQIPDPVLAELERVMMARSLLGVPVHGYLIAYPKNGYCAVAVNTFCDTLPTADVQH